LVEEIAKRAAHSQPEVVKQLGSNGIKDLRRRLADTAAEIASEVEAAAGRAEGLSVQSELSRAEPGNVDLALFRFLDGRRVDSLAAVLKRHGFSIQDDNAQGSQGMILAQHLYHEGDFVPVAEALSALARAEKAVAVARAANDRDIVDSLWADSRPVA
jgi:hypothetical protein